MPDIPLFVSAALLAVLALAGGAAFKRLKLPAPFLLGPLTAVCAANLAGLPFPMLPAFIDSAAQVVLGFFLGANITRENYRELRAVSLPAALMALSSLVITLVFGYFLYRVTPLSLATAMLSSSPGGAPEVSIIALSVNADVATVTVMQVARLLAVILFVPFLSRAAGKRDITPDAGRGTAHSGPAESAPARAGKIHVFFAALLNPGLAVALGGGALFYYLGVPAGFMIGAMVAVGAASIGGLKIKPLPEPARVAVHIVIGILIGQFFTREALAGVAGIYPVILLLTGLMLASCAVLALLISRITGWRLSICLLAAAPGGLVTMTTLASEIKEDPLKVSLLHLARLLTIKLTLPLLVLLIS